MVILAALVSVGFAPLVQASGDLQAMQLDGERLRIQSDSAWLFAEAAPGNALTFSVQGSVWDVHVVDESKGPAVRNPLSTSDNLFANSDRSDEFPAVGMGGTLEITSIRDGGAVALVQPLTADYFLTADSKGAYAVKPIDTKVLEESHFRGRTTPPHPEFYEYTVEDTLEVNLTDAASAVVTGDLQIYLWGVQALLRDAGQSQTLTTGYSGEEIQPGVWNENFTYAVLTIRGAVLEFSGESQALSLYADSFGATSVGDVQVHDGSGILAGAHGDYRLAGDATIEGGRYVWSHGEDAIAIEVLDQANAATGSVSFLPTPFHERAWFPYALGAMLVGLAIAGTWVAPVVAGYPRSDDRSQRRALREIRAKGFARWALAAEGRARLGLAAFWMARATRNSPQNAEYHLERGTFLRQAGKPRLALASHRRAHELLQGAFDDAAVHNAYEAARAAAVAGLEDEAVDWLRQAVDADPGLAEEAQVEADFVKLRQNADFQSLRGPSHGVVSA